MHPLFKKLIIRVLTAEARAVLRKYQPKIIGVTGSVGKTSTKDAIYHALKKDVYVRKSEKSFNNEIGVPLTVLGVPTGWGNYFVWILIFIKGLWLIIWKHKYPEWLVLELGVGKPDDMSYLTSWLTPDVAVFTSFGTTPVHVEYFQTKEDVWREKQKLADALRPHGLLVLNNDDENVMGTMDLFEGEIATFGYHTDSQVRIENQEYLYEEDSVSGISFELVYKEQREKITIVDSVGFNIIYSVLVGVSVAMHVGLSFSDACKRFDSFVTPPGRLRLIPGVKNTVIIDDTYNSSPLACEAALETLRNIKAQGKKYVVLGDMLELGKYSDDEHIKIGRIAGGIADEIILVGLRVRFVTQGAQEVEFEKHIHEFRESKDAGNFIENFMEPGDIVLVKGSQGVRMERIVIEIMRHPENKEELLVRQEPQWVKKD